ncbi:MAG: GTPase Der [marine bacterium B5-7]|nr:MAG: GTPase Der [marine bacterium B5-7]
MIPVIALVGRPNVGKSTLFNTLTRSRDAIVHDQPGLTRDRLYGSVKRDRIVRALVVDTGGLGDDSDFAALIDEQVEQVLAEADEIVFVVDYEQGLSGRDAEIAQTLRRHGKPVHLAVNKSEGIEGAMAVTDFQSLGLGESWAISAKRGDRVEALLDHMLERYPSDESLDGQADDGRIRVAIVGRPNAGKSTLINALLGESRVIVKDEPGTTRDSVSIPFSRAGREFELIDTAGVRRKQAVTGTIEKFSIVRTLRAIERAHVCVLMLDAQREISDQDAAIAGMIDARGRSIVVVVNKWDNLEPYARKRVQEQFERRLRFLAPHEVMNISALHGSRVGDIIPAVVRAYDSAMIEFKTSDLNRRLEAAVAAQSPPMYNGHPVKLKFAHQEDRNPPSIIIHGNRLDHIPQTYTRYISNFLQKSYRLTGTRIRVVYRTDENPYAKRVGQGVRYLRRGKPVQT